jgi:hypothetical protein
MEACQNNCTQTGKYILVSKRGIFLSVRHTSAFLPLFAVIAEAILKNGVAVMLIPKVANKPVLIPLVGIYAISAQHHKSHICGGDRVDYRLDIKIQA